MCKMLVSVLLLVYIVASPAVTAVSRPRWLSPHRTFDVRSADLSLSRNKRQSTCRKDQWPCRDGSCISFDGKCDGAVDCPDGSDETHALCRNIPCQSNWFRCTYGACADGTAPCNGVQECADNSDELLPRCRNETLEVRGKFKCANGIWIPASDHCDGISNCLDGSDETVASCGEKICSSHLFQCAYGACVDHGADCNGIQECADGSDESDELCDRIGTPVVKPIPKPGGACVLPPYPDHGTYEVANVPNARPGQAFNDYVLTVSCQRGYGLLNPDGGRDGNGTLQVYCVSASGVNQTVPQCVQFCRLDPSPSITYMCKVPGTTGFAPCKQYVEPGVSAQPICNAPNFYSPDELKYMNCIAGSWDYLALCKPECGRVTPKGVGLMSGGVYAVRGELPWHVGIYTKTTTPYKQICGGSLISNTIVLSAAHCFWSDRLKRLPASDYAVAIGKIYRPWNNERELDAQKSDVKELKIPSLFSGAEANFQEDIAVVILVTPFVYHTFVRPVCLNFDTNFEKGQLVHGNLGKVAGWGRTAENGASSQILKVTEMPFINIDTCIETLPPSFRENITGDKICAGYTNGTAVCEGDSGGGLAFPDKQLGIERYYLRGIVSTAPPNEHLCNVYTYTTFTRITKHENFIKEYL